MRNLRSSLRIHISKNRGKIILIRCYKSKLNPDILEYIDIIGDTGCDTNYHTKDSHITLYFTTIEIY